MTSYGRRSDLAGTHDARTKAVRTRGVGHDEERGHVGLKHEERKVRGQHDVNGESARVADRVEKILGVEVGAE